MAAIEVRYMTYKYNKESGWIGFCDGCGQLFQPQVVDGSVYVVENRNKKQFEIDFSKKGYKGFCEACCKSEDTVGYRLALNIKETKLLVRKLGKVMVV
jgi:hypothetical protein